MSDSYRDLRVWQRAMEFVTAVYESTQNFPKAELFGLVSQMRRAAVSIPCNIAEGKGRITDRADPISIPRREIPSSNWRPKS